MNFLLNISMMSKIFFIECHHLGDWISKSEGLNVYEFVNRSEELSLCRDICNGVKHLTLWDKKSKIDDPHLSIIFKQREAGSFNKGEISGVQIIPVIISNDSEIDLIDVMSICVKSWEEFLKENNINLPSS